MKSSIKIAWLVACFMIVVVGGCSPVVTDGLRPTASARYIWSVPFEGNRLNISGDGRLISAYQGAPYMRGFQTRLNITLDASTGGQLDIGVPERAWILAHSPDGQKVIYRDSSNIQVLYHATRERGNSAFVGHYDEYESGLTWIDNENAVLVFYGDVEFYNYWKVGAPYQGNVAKDDLSALKLIGGNDAYWFSRSITARYVQCSRDAILDVETKEVIRAQDGQHIGNTWPLSSGDAFYHISNMAVESRRPSGEIFNHIPFAFNLDGTVATQGFERGHIEAPFASPSGRYLAVLRIGQQVGDAVWMNHMNIVDTRTAESVTRIFMNDWGAGIADLVFDPNDERTVYMLSSGVISRWRIE